MTAATEPNIASNEHRYVSVPQAAALAGVSANTMRKLLDQGRIPFIKPSQHRRVRIRDLKTYLANSVVYADRRIARLPNDPLHD